MWKYLTAWLCKSNHWGYIFYSTVIITLTPTDIYITHKVFIRLYFATSELAGSELASELAASELAAMSWQWNAPYLENVFNSKYFNEKLGKMLQVLNIYILKYAFFCPAPLSPSQPHSAVRVGVHAYCVLKDINNKKIIRKMPHLL